MVADDAALNVDAAVQMAHALGIHEATPDFDFYTAIDDRQKQAEETGAGMMGTIEMMSSTMYRYATVNVDMLYKNLGSAEATVRAIKAFSATFVESLPSGKQNTFASHTLPELVNVAIRDRRPVSYVNAFESPVSATSTQSRNEVAIAKLAEEASFVADTYGAEPTASWVVTRPALEDAARELGNAVTFGQLIKDVEGAVGTYLQSDEDAE